MQRRDFLRKGVALGVAALLPGTGVPAIGGFLPSSPIPAVEPLMPIWEAAVGGHWHIVKEWLRRDPSLINVTGKVEIRTPYPDTKYPYCEEAPLFHLAAAFNPNVDFLEYLISQGADVNAKTEENGTTPLHFAAEWNSVEVVKCLVACGGDTNMGNKWSVRRRIPLYRAAWFNPSVDVLQYLVSLATDVDPTSLLSVAVGGNRNVEVLRYLVSLGADVNVRDDCRFTLLHLAASHNSVEVLEYLISQGIDVNALDGFRRTVLYYAGVFNNAEVMQYLISQGADVNVIFGSGGTVLNNCCDPMDFHGKEDVAKKKRIVREAMER